MLANRVCTSILHWLGSVEHWLGSFETASKNFQIFLHWLGSFEILPNQCKMLAHSTLLYSLTIYRAIFDALLHFAQHLYQKLLSNSWMSAWGSIKLHPFGTHVSLGSALVLKGCNLFAPLALIQQLLIALFFHCKSNVFSCHHVSTWI